MWILVVDDEFPAVALEDVGKATGATIVLARTEREAADAMVGKAPGTPLSVPDLILMDGYLEPNSDRPRDTQNLVRFLRRCGYQGPIMAISGDPGIQQKLVQAGCTEAWHKGKVVMLLKQWIREHTQ